MPLVTWVLWALITTAFNLVNSLNSRAKNSLSWRYNAISTAATSTLYILSMLGVGNVILASHTHATLAIAVVTYMVCSTIGSTVGQEIAIHYLKRIENRN